MALSSEPSANAPTSLTERLRDHTAVLHREAERSGVIAVILHRRADARAHALLLRNLLPAYAAMEAALAGSATQPLLGAFADRSLHRSAAIRADLAAFDPEWVATLPLLESGEQYGQHVSRLAATSDIRLAAHAYVRYFGDLSGGQILKPLLMRTLGLPATALSFYEFEGLDPQVAKGAMRSRIDDDATPADAAVILDEALVAFRHNIAVSEAVRGAGPMLAPAHAAG